MVGTFKRIAYKKLGSGEASNDIDTGEWTGDYDRLKVRIFLTQDSGNQNPEITFNDTDSGYGYKYGINNANGSDVNGSNFLYHFADDNGDKYITMDIINIKTKEKNVFARTTWSASGDNAPSHGWLSGKWSNTSSSIKQIELKNAFTGNFGVGSYIIVLGASDDTVTDEKTTLADATVTTTPTSITDDLTTDDGWVSTSSDWAYNTSDYLYLDPIRRSTTSQQIYIDLQDSDYLGSNNNLHATKWVTRFKFETETLTSATGNAEVFIGLSDTSGASAQATNQDMVYLSINGNSNEPVFYFYGVAGTGMLTSRTGAGFSPSISNSTTTFYCEIVRNSDVYTARVTTSDDYTGGSTATITKSGLTDLRWLKLSNDNEQNGQTWKGKLHEVKIYNGVTSAASTTSSAAPPVNTRYEEVDTRKIYRKVTPTQVSFSDDFSSDDWNYSRAGTEIQVTGNKMVFTNFANGGQWRSAYRSTGLDINDTKWVLRFKFRFSAASSQSFWILGLSSGTSNPTGSSDYIVGAYFVDTPYMEIAKKSSSDSYRSWTAGNVFNPSADTDYYIQIIRTSATEVQMKMFTNSNFSDGLVGTNTQTIDSNYAGLDNLMISNQSNGSSSRTITGEIDDIKIYNGVTSVDTDEWKERGSA